MSAPEFPRLVDLRSLSDAPVVLQATPEECAALARRFDLVAVHALTAEIALAATGTTIEATGRLSASIVQPCAVSGEDLAVAIDEPLALRFVPERPIEVEELELEEAELDEIPYTGTAFDLGEAVAQSLALAIDPYATGPDAERVRTEQGLSTPEASGPFAALAALRNPEASR